MFLPKSLVSRIIGSRAVTAYNAFSPITRLLVGAFAFYAATFGLIWFFLGGAFAFSFVGMTLALLSMAVCYLAYCIRFSKDERRQNSLLELLTGHSVPPRFLARKKSRPPVEKLLPGTVSAKPCVDHLAEPPPHRVRTFKASISLTGGGLASARPSALAAELGAIRRPGGLPQALADLK